MACEGHSVTWNNLIFFFFLTSLLHVMIWLQIFCPSRMAKWRDRNVCNQLHHLLHILKISLPFPLIQTLQIPTGSRPEAGWSTNRTPATSRNCFSIWPIEKVPSQSLFHAYSSPCNHSPTQTIPQIPGKTTVKHLPALEGHSRPTNLKP